MTSVEFCYWLQGYFEIHGKASGRRAGQLSAKQVENIKKHLAMVFEHEIDLSYPKNQQAALNKIHNSDDDLIRC